MTALVASGSWEADDDVTERPDDLTQRLRGQAKAILKELIPAGSRCALVDFPANPNVGDNAIWLGERLLLEEIGVEIVYACDRHSFSEAELAASLPQGTILLHGGGNLGDLWPDHEIIRERVISGFPHHRIIQLPQSVHFTKASNLDRAREVFAAHPDLTVLLRDRRSLSFAQKELSTQSFLCPDLAFALGSGAGTVCGSVAPRHEVLWLARTDHESRCFPAISAGPGVHRTDWIHAEPAIDSRRELNSSTQASVLVSYDARARFHLRRGCLLLCEGRVIVTDRLHGHVLSLLLGMPHVLMEDRYGKIRAFWETWTHEWTGAVWAESPEEALKLVMAISSRNQRSPS